MKRVSAVGFWIPAFAGMTSSGADPQWRDLWEEIV
jgi:hypothetical protein